MSEVRLEEMSKQTVSACRESRLDRNLTERSSSRNSRSRTGERKRSRSQGDGNRSRSSTRSQSSGETKSKSSVPCASKSSSSVTQGDEPVGELSRNLGELSLGGSAISQSGGGSQNISTYVDTGSERGDGVTASSTASFPTQPQAESVSLKQSMKAFLPDSPDQSGDEIQGAMGGQNPVADEQPAGDDTIFEHEIWGRNGTPGSDVSRDSSELMFGLQQQSEQFECIVAQNDELRKELDHVQFCRKRDHDEAEKMLLDREREIDSLRQKLQVAESEKSSIKRSNEIIAAKIEMISDLKKQVALLEKALAESEEEAVSYKKQFELERASKLEEVASLKEEVEILIRSSKEKEQKCLSLKQRLDKLKRESSTVLGSMKRTSSTLSLRGSEASHDKVLMLGADEYVEGADDDGGAEITRPTLSKNDMHKRLAAAKWPERKIFHSFDEFIAALKSQATILYQQGIDYEEIAFNLNTAIMSSDLASDFAAHKKHRKLTLENILNAVEACDKASTLFTNSEKFSLITRGQSESLFSLMRRLESGFIDYKIGDPKDLKAKLRILKKRFCEAANLPNSVQQSIRNCTDLDDVVVFATEDLAKLEKDKQELQSQSMPLNNAQNFQQRQFGQKNHGGFKQNFQSRPQWPQQQQAPQRQQQQHRPLMQQNLGQQQNGAQQQQGGEINAMVQPRVYTSPDPSLPRAPTNFERQRENKEIMVCLRCRIMDSHRAKDCEYFKYCSLCSVEGHTDFEHRKVAEGQSAAAGRNGLQQQQRAQPQQIQPQQARPQPVQPQQAQPQPIQPQQAQPQQMLPQQVRPQHAQQQQPQQVPLQPQPQPQQQGQY